ncbi:asparagine synthase (glutamine-hydrolyzing) [Roseivirga sp. E12]|uniref:asparagine synthase (glutamine-hydrolyzing) n=1 Tax=Roseivirga sp. E12 TaxID=2819237 RepID=UPI001ABD0402|nr:asparagine synthase (glutamine-hydrolyzing) [Roseivirga sp. E12]
MCGFLGQFNCTKLPQEQFASLLATSKNRGPDQTGFWSNEYVQMGFNRLSILEPTSAGDQPMLSPSGRFVVLFNGEVYNHKRLREKLPQTNYKGNSDTETISVALENWGVKDTIISLDGMFAIVIFDRQSKTIFLARDFAGIKPLFFGQYANQIVFGSQYDQVQQHPLFKNAPIDPQVLKLFLKQHFMPAPYGLHQGLAQVKPGEIIKFALGGKVENTRYWEAPSSPQFEITNPLKAERLVQEELQSCVRDQLLSDVPLGAFLSGGVDSPLICSFAAQEKANLKVFSIGSDSTVHDESERSHSFAKAMDLDQELWKLDSKEVIEHWENAMNALHEPLADFSILPTYLVSKLAKKHVSVALSGDGGDELFFGYQRFWSVGKNIRFQHWPKLMRMGLYGWDKYRSGNRNLNSVLLTSSQGEAHELLHSRFKDEWLYKVFPDLQSVKLPEDWDLYNYSNSSNQSVLLNNMRKAEFYGMMQKTLRKVDLASMENSLEVRVPFLNKKLIELSFKIDPELNSGKNKKKQILKNIIAHRIPQVPDDNVKRGFSIPLDSWMREDLKPVFSDVLLSGQMDRFGVNQHAVESMMTEHSSELASHKWPLFTLYALQSSIS